MTAFRTLAPGTACGPYTIVKELGRGGIAIVYLAEGPGPHGTHYAVKTLQFAKGLDDKKMRRFNREIQVAGRIHHINVVRFFDAGRVESDGARGLVWMAQEYIDGVTLREIIHAQGGRLPYDDIARWCAQIADGVAAAHAVGVIHRDLKPENVMLNTSDTIKVIDFNIAKFRGWGTTSTGRGKAVGTLGYMAPEQLDPKSGQITERTDVYALGLILFELATGHSALAPRGEQLMVQELLARTHVFDPPRLDDLRPGLPTELADIAERALHKDPAERFANMTEIREALTAFVRQYTDVRLQAALRAIGHEELQPDASGWQPGQKRTVKMATPEEARAHPAAEAASVDATIPMHGPLLEEAADPLDKSTGVGVTAPASGRTPFSRKWPAIAAGVVSGSSLGLLALLFVVPLLFRALSASTDPAPAAAPPSPVTSDASSAAPSSPRPTVPMPSAPPRASTETRPQPNVPATTVKAPKPPAPQWTAPRPAPPAAPNIDELYDDIPLQPAK